MSLKRPPILYSSFGFSACGMGSGFYFIWITNMKNNKKGSIELIVLGLLAALIVVLAVPFLSSIGNLTSDALESTQSAMSAAM